jgi:murein L,D-transpeptidase YafK
MRMPSFVRHTLRITLFVILCSIAPMLAQAEPPTLVPQGLLQLGNGTYYPAYGIVVDKKARVLSLWKQTGTAIEKVLEFPSDIGKKLGNKSKLGDHRTPEGIYFTQKMLEGPGLLYDKYGVKAFTLDYPNLFDQRAGKTGSGIWLHAIPDKETLERGSRGCVVIRNESITELSKHISVERTPVLIYESVPYVTVDEKKKLSHELENFLAQWIQSWKTENIDAYMSFYSSKFKAMKMNQTQWRSYKTELNQKYSNIEISLYSPVVFEHSGGYIVRSLQAYRSSEFEDFGEKTLYLEKTPEGLKIISELWTAMPNPNIIQNLAKCCSEGSSAN